MSREIGKIASMLHDEWRAQYKLTDGTYAHRERDGVDIANTNYEDLPEKYKKENRISAEIAFEQINLAISEGKALDEDFIEATSDILHAKWLERNAEYAKEYQKLPYAELSEEEKDKDRLIIRKAIEVYLEEIE